MIDYSLHNNGAPIQIGEGLQVTAIEYRQSVTTPTTLDNPLGLTEKPERQAQYVVEVESLRKNQKSTERKKSPTTGRRAAEKVAKQCEYVDYGATPEGVRCGAYFKGDARRKFCDAHTVRRASSETAD